jgi:hypothetical protein
MLFNMTVTLALCTKVSLSLKLIPFVSTFAITFSIFTIGHPTRGSSTTEQRPRRRHQEVFRARDNSSQPPTLSKDVEDIDYARVDWHCRLNLSTTPRLPAIQSTELCADNIWGISVLFWIKDNPERKRILEQQRFGKTDRRQDQHRSQDKVADGDSKGGYEQQRRKRRKQFQQFWQQVEAC